MSPSSVAAKKSITVWTGKRKGEKEGDASKGGNEDDVKLIMDARPANLQIQQQLLAAGSICLEMA